jgi:hypothetical protein
VGYPRCFRYLNVMNVLLCWLQNKCDLLFDICFSLLVNKSDLVKFEASLHRLLTKEVVFYFFMNMLVFLQLQAVAGLAADGRQIVARAKSEATNYERSALLLWNV